MDPWLMALLSVFLVSLVSLVGIAAFSIHEAFLKRAMFALIGLAAGALLGNAILHLIPESLEAIGNAQHFGLAVLGGIAVFFVLEKVMRWHHAHHGPEEEHIGHEVYEADATHTHIAPMVLAADGLHNVIDGAVIAASYLISPALGIATTIAVFLHEIPQEISDYALLIHAGYTRRRALFFNFLSGLSAILGAGAVLILGTQIEFFAAYAAAVTAGAFIYLAAADLLPELNKRPGLHKSAVELAAFLFGIGIMFALAAISA